MARIQVAGRGEGSQIWRVAANIIDKAVAANRQGVILQFGGWAWG